MTYLQRLRDRAHSDGEILALLLLPVVLALLMPSWTYLAPLSWIDPYLYTGYFLDLSKYIEAFGPTYYGSRLPWLLLGSGLNSLFSFEVANLILRFVLFYGGVLSIYFAVRLAWRDRVAAFLTAVWLGVTGPFLGAVSWDNPDGAATSWMFVAIGFATAAAATANQYVTKACIFATGFMTMIFVSTQMYTVTFSPLPLIWFLVLDRTRHKHDLVYSALFFALGALSAVGFVGYMSTRLGGPFNYLQPQIDAVRSLRGQDYYQGGFEWIKEAGWLAIPALGVLVSLGLVARSVVLAIKKRGRFWLIGADNLTMGYAALIPIGMAVFYFYRLVSLHTPEVQVFYYTSYFLPFIFLPFGAALTLILSRLSSRTKLIVGVVGTMILLAPFTSHLFRPDERCFRPACTIGDEGVKIVIVAALLVLALSIRRIEPAFVGFIVLIVLNMGASDPRFVRFEDTESYYDQFLQIERVSDRLSPYDKDGRLLFWLSPLDDPNSGVANGVVALHLYGFRLAGVQFPTLGVVPGANKHKFVTGERFAVLSSRPNVASEAVETINSEGFGSKVLASFSDSRAGAEPLNVAILVIELPSDVTRVVDLDVAVMAAIPGSTISRGPSGVTVTTQETHYAYSALLPVPPEVRQAYSGKSGFVRVEGIAGKGYTGVGVLKNDRSGWAVVAQFPPKTGAAFDLFLPIPSWDDTSDLIVMNWDKDGVGTATISKVSIYIKDDKTTP